MAYLVLKKLLLYLHSESFIRFINRFAPNKINSLELMLKMVTFNGTGSLYFLNSKNVGFSLKSMNLKKCILWSK